MARSRILTIKQVKEIVDLYESGFSIREVAKMYGRCYSTIHYHLHKQGVELRAANMPYNINRTPHYLFDQTVFLYHNLGLSSSQVAKVMGCHQTTVIDRLHKAGRPPRARTVKVTPKASPDSISLQTRILPKIHKQNQLAA